MKTSYSDFDKKYVFHCLVNNKKVSYDYCNSGISTEDAKERAGYLCSDTKFYRDGKEIQTSLTHFFTNKNENL